MSAAPITTLKDVVPLPQWVAWRNETRADGKTTKVPYASANRKAEADNPATWTTYDRAELLSSTIVNGSGGGVGVELGQCGQSWLIGIDLDTCRDPDTGTIEPWAIEVIDRFASNSEVSPSTKGVKIYAQINPDDVLDLQRIMGTETGRQFKKAGSGDHPPAIELYVSSRFFAVTWEGLDNAPSELRTVPLSDLKWLIEEAGPRFAGKTADKSSTDKSRSAAAFRKCAALRRPVNVKQVAARIS